MHSLRIFCSEGGCSVDRAWVADWISARVCRCSESRDSCEKVVRLMGLGGRAKSKGRAVEEVEEALFSKPDWFMLACLVMLIPSGGSTRDAEICDTGAVKGYGPIYSESEATKRKIKYI